jgi:hypothetical protein
MGLQFSARSAELIDFPLPSFHLEPGGALVQSRFNERLLGGEEKDGTNW